VKVLIADDHPLVRDALARTVRVLVPDVEILEAKDYAGTEAGCRELPELVMLDLDMPGMNGTEGVRRLRDMFSGLKFAVVSAERHPATIRRVMSMGVVGFLPKGEHPDILMQAIQLVRAGGTYLPIQILQGLVGEGMDETAKAVELTPRQLEVLRCLARGAPNKVIAAHLDLSQGTVRIHLAAIFRILGVRNRTEAVIVARKLGLVD
jgi:DNA-binding NarL/FixJ family response regulator